MRYHIYLIVNYQCPRTLRLLVSPDQRVVCNIPPWIIHRAQFQNCQPKVTPSSNYIGRDYPTPFGHSISQCIILFQRGTPASFTSRYWQPLSWMAVVSRKHTNIYTYISCQFCFSSLGENDATVKHVKYSGFAIRVFFGATATPHCCHEFLKRINQQGCDSDLALIPMHNDCCLYYRRRLGGCVSIDNWQVHADPIQQCC